MPKCKFIIKNGSSKCWLCFRLFLWQKKNTFCLQFRSSFKKQWKYTNRVVVLYIKRIIIFKNWSDISFFQAVRKDTSFKKFMQLANTENVNLCCFKIFISISPPADLLLLKPMITLLHIIYRNMLKQKFNSNIKILFGCFDSRMIYSTITCI